MTVRRGQGPPLTGPRSTLSEDHADEGDAQDESDVGSAESDHDRYGIGHTSCDPEWQIEIENYESCDQN